MHVEDKDLTTELQDDAGEPLRAAVYARVSTVVSPARWLGPLGNYLIARPAARASAKATEEATDVPLDAAVVLGIAAETLHVWRADPMLSRVGDHLGTVPLARFSSITGETGKSWWPIVLTLEDGDTVELEARGDVRSFLDAAA
ncbi:hypothetical protein [Patulibacter minatonensis]|uniref:hypothetical protein n=1 Tax=Patulibacter minatonensis TaxID=298163 RepID=UPI00047E17AE|nr:hypothetical protein [Patulibacter minatonensis]